MRARLTRTAEPPDRLPYVRVHTRAIGHDVVLRLPSPYGVGLFVRALEREQVSSILAVVLAVEAGGSLVQSLVAARSGAADAFALLGALVGMSWVDPDLELESPVPAEWTAESVQAFGAGVLEELHEAGWDLMSQVGCGLAILGQLSERMALEQEVAERLRFFRRTGPTTGSGSTSSSTSFTAESGPSGAAS